MVSEPLIKPCKPTFDHHEIILWIWIRCDIAMQASRFKPNTHLKHKNRYRLEFTWNLLSRIETNATIHVDIWIRQTAIRQIAILTSVWSAIALRDKLQLCLRVDSHVPFADIHFVCTIFVLAYAMRTIGRDPMNYAAIRWTFKFQNGCWGIRNMLDKKS